MCPQIAKDAIADYRRDPARIVLIGHSMGGTCAISFAEMLEAEHIPVSLLVTTEPNRISHKVPRNVERYINIFQTNSLLGGFNTETVPDFRGHVATFDLAKHSEVSHVNMSGSIAIGIAAGVLALIAAYLGPGRWTYLPLALDDWIFSRAYIRRGDPELERRLDAVAEEILAADHGQRG